MATKAQVGWTAVVFAALALVGINSQVGTRSSSDAAESPRRIQAAKPVKPASLSPFASGPCGEIESVLQTYLLTPESDVVAPPSCYAEGKEDSKQRDAQQDRAKAVDLSARAAGLQYVIAILPDPLHTHFSLAFDRLAESIQQGAQDEGYLYDSSWLPWETQATSGDQEKADEQTGAREDQPGILLFRRGAASKSVLEEKPYEDGLIVLVVGEEPTSGLHKRQFENAVAWINALRPQASATRATKPVKILGPTFSGSLPSLAQLLAEDKQFARLVTPAANPASPELSIYSGGITSEVMVRWFNWQTRNLNPAATPVPVDFHSFQQSGAVQIQRYRDYLLHSGFDLSHLAIISEDETAYGGLENNGPAYIRRAGASDPCAPEMPGKMGPACLYYPRDISAVRDAYQKQSIFSSRQAQQTATAAQQTLATDLADPEGRRHDTIRNYSDDQAALSQEAVLLQIVSLLKAHQSEYIILRSSNPLDQQFLSHFLRLTYPEGRIVIEGTDLLLRRETGAAALSGIMTLTTYPLLPWEHHWTGGPFYTTSHSHRVFSQDLAEGNYIATRFLLRCSGTLSSAATLSGKDPVSEAFLPPACNDLHLRDYSPPFWALAKPKPDDSKDSPEIEPENLQPPTWISVLGRDGFWPVAALTNTNNPRWQDASPAGAKPSGGRKLSDWCLRQLVRAGGSLLSLARLLGLSLFFWKDSSAGYAAGGAWPAMPPGMKICLVCIAAWTGFHLYCCARPSLTVKPGHRAHFVRMNDRSHPVLIVFGSVILAFVPILLGWGFGAMSAAGEPVPHGWAYRIFLPVIWILGGVAIGSNAWVESPHYSTLSRLRAERTSFQEFRGLGKMIWSVSRKPLGYYVAATALLYCVVDFSLNETLSDANRVPTFWRAMHLTTGVSPLVPLLSLTAGLYLWFWYSLQGLALFGDGRPELPSRSSLQLEGENGKKLEPLCMFSQELMLAPIERLACPFSREVVTLAIILAPMIFVISWLIEGGVPLRSLGSRDYSVFFCIGMDICVSIMLANAWQLLRIWLRLRQLLLFMDRTPLRRTLIALKGYSWGSVWRMGGNVLDVRYKLLSRQLESLHHVTNTAAGMTPVARPDQQALIAEELREADTALHNFAGWYSKHWDDWRTRDLTALSQYQKRVASATGALLSQSLVFEWRAEKKSLIAGPGAKDTNKEADKNGSGADEIAAILEKLVESAVRLRSRAALSLLAAVESSSEEKQPQPKDADADHAAYIANAEELVCLVYLGCIQNVLGRLRTLVMGMLWLFVAASFSVATYPFDPRPALSAAMLLLFLVMGAAIVIVYSQMHRDATLSHVTNTEPGELGSEFWLKLIGFGAGPLIGLLATVFPELTGSLFSWLQPGLASIK